jgi:hypothetical protein
VPFVVEKSWAVCYGMGVQNKAKLGRDGMAGEGCRAADWWPKDIKKNGLATLRSSSLRSTRRCHYERGQLCKTKPNCARPGIGQQETGWVAVQKQSQLEGAWGAGTSMAGKGICLAWGLCKTKPIYGCWA